MNVGMLFLLPFLPPFPYFSNIPEFVPCLQGVTQGLWSECLRASKVHVGTPVPKVVVLEGGASGQLIWLEGSPLV